jgi:hypothetical protein
MNLLTEFLLEGIVEADKTKVVALYGGAFKPPTKGHFNVIQKAADQNPEIDEILVYVGGGERDGISQGESIQIWELYKKYLPLKVKFEPSKAPIGDILRYAKEHPEEKILWIIGARENNPDDFADISSRTRTIDKYPNLQLRVIQTSGGVSGTAARKAVKDNNKEQFFNMIPDISEKQQVWDIVSPVIREVGEANLKPYKWEEVDREGYYVYTRFITNSETQYDVDLETMTYTPKDSTSGIKAIGVEFSAKLKDAEGSSAKIVVNKGEMYKVMSTIVDIVKKYIKKFKAQAIIYSPSKKSSEEDFGTQRDQLYKAFITKAIPGVKFEQKGDMVVAILPGVNEGSCGYDTDVATGKKLNTPGGLEEADPKKGTGKKPKGSGRRLYTDEDPKDTVRIKFKTKEDIVDTLNKTSFKAKSHARQSQVINLIHQRVRAAYSKSKDPEVKSRLKRALDYIESRKESSKAKTQRLNKMKEASDPQAGTALPYGSGFAPVKENDPFGLNELARQFVKEALIETWNPKESFVSLSQYMIDNGMNIQPLPKIKVISDDEDNASNFLGKTAYYNPTDKSITLYTMDRHPKDILRSFAHEMVHHEQNLEGRLGNINTTNTSEDGHLDKIEREAIEIGGIMLRNWEDSIKNS